MAMSNYALGFWSNHSSVDNIIFFYFSFPFIIWHSAFQTERKGFLTAVCQPTEKLHIQTQRFVRPGREKTRQELHMYCNKIFSFNSIILHGNDDLCF